MMLTYALQPRRGARQASCSFGWTCGAAPEEPSRKSHCHPPPPTHAPGETHAIESHPIILDALGYPS